jgi:hypothetical protein
MVVKSTNIKLLFFIIVSSLYGYYLALLPSFLFRDRGNYVNYASYSDVLLDLYKTNISILFKEPLFLLMNKWLMFLKNPDTTVSVFVFFACFCTMFFMLKFSKNIFHFILFFLFVCLNVQSFAMQLVTFRQGVGLGVILLYLIFSRRDIKYLNFIILVVFLGFIHTSFFVVALMLFFDWFFVNFLQRRDVKFRVTGVFLASLLLNIFIIALASILGAKQNYEDFQQSSGGGAFIVWGCVLFYLLKFKFNNASKADDKTLLMYMLAVNGLILYLTSYFLSPIAGRIIGTFIPFIAYSLLFKPSVLDYSFFVLLIIVFSFIFFNGGVEGFMEVKLEKLISYII